MDLRNANIIFIIRIIVTFMCIFYNSSELELGKRSFITIIILKIKYNRNITIIIVILNIIVIISIIINVIMQIFF